MSNLSFLPDQIYDNLTQTNNPALKHLYFLKDVWNAPNGQENWCKLTQQNKTQASLKAEEDFQLNIQYRLNNTIKNMSKETRTMVEDLYTAYYTGNFSPILFGVYFDGKGFWESMKYMTESEIQKTTLRYWETFTAVAMYGALDASMKNPKTNKEFNLSNFVEAKHQLKNVVSYMRNLPENFAFKTLENYRPLAAKQNIANNWTYAGILNLAYEARKYRQVSVENMHTLEDASGAYKTPIQWLNMFNEQINQIEDTRNLKRSL